MSAVLAQPAAHVLCLQRGAGDAVMDIPALWLAYNLAALPKVQSLNGGVVDGKHCPSWGAPR